MHLWAIPDLPCTNISGINSIKPIITRQGWNGTRRHSSGRTSFRRTRMRYWYWTNLLMKMPLMLCADTVCRFILFLFLVSLPMEIVHGKKFGASERFWCSHTPLHFFFLCCTRASRALHELASWWCLINRQWRRYCEIFAWNNMLLTVWYCMQHATSSLPMAGQTDTMIWWNPAPLKRQTYVYAMPSF